MTRYEELQAELQAEQDKLVADFQGAVEEGDYALYQGTNLGIMIKRTMARGGTELVFYPINITAVDANTLAYALTLDAEHVAQMELLGKDMDKVNSYLQASTKAYSKANEGIPF